MIKYSVLWAGIAIFWLSCLNYNISRIIRHVKGGLVRECRIFVEQNDGIVSCCEVAPVSFQYRRRIKVSGLKNATVRFLAEEYCKDNVNAVLNSDVDNFFRTDKFESGYVEVDRVKFFEAKNITGSLVLSMPFKS